MMAISPHGMAIINTLITPMGSDSKNPPKRSSGGFAAELSDGERSATQVQAAFFLAIRYPPNPLLISNRTFGMQALTNSN